MAKTLRIGLISLAVALVVGSLLSPFLLGVVRADGPTRWGFGWPFGGMMGGGMMGGGMMSGGIGGYGWGGSPYAGNTVPISMDDAVNAVQSYLSAWGTPDLAMTEVMEFQNNFYAEVKETSTGVHAFELLVNKYSGAVYPEMGPNMMWNSKYGMMGGAGGMMGGMMGGYYGYYGPGGPTATMPVTRQVAQQSAQRYLDRYLPGTSTEEPDTFYGYYTLHTFKDGKVTGMLSVNGYTGRVWYHSWHGPFVQMREFD